MKTIHNILKGLIALYLMTSGIFIFIQEVDTLTTFITYKALAILVLYTGANLLIDMKPTYLSNIDKYYFRIALSLALVILIILIVIQICLW
jgi:hypothetical protein